ncbi:MAG: FapA family protein [Ruminococcus sp.]|jgi:uncharacterized protein (DUF342 family)|nr:FapA family protein [Ruminococcus sp.]
MAEVNENNAPIDCVIIATINSNNSVAAVTVMAPQNGGTEVSTELIMKALDDKGVKAGIIEETVNSIAREKLYNTDFVVARWKQAENGVDGEITYHFEKSVEGKPTENSKGNVNYKDLGIIRTVLRNTIIADITLPTDGEAGYDVRGTVLQPRPGKKASYQLGPGTQLINDDTQISAVIDGALFWRNNSFCVEPDITLKDDIDFKTGNIEFIGDITVNGDILEGFKVVSQKGSVTVKGAVFGGEVSAGIDVTLKKGCNHAKITAGGNIDSLFCEYSNINCAGDFTAQNLILCDVYCGGALRTKAGSGGLVGGRYTIIGDCEVGNIGSQHYPITEITLGNNAVLATEKEDLQRGIATRNQEVHDLGLIIDYLNNKKKELRGLPEDKEEILGNSVRQRLIKGREIQKMNKRIDEIDDFLSNRQNLRINCKGTIYPKTKIIINQSRCEVVVEWKRVSVYLDEDNEFKFAPL